MTYLAWATAYEGSSDRTYFEVLIPRILTDIALRDGLRPVQVPEAAAVQLGSRGRAVEQVAAEICRHADAFHLAFVHADTGGRAIQRTLDARSQSYCARAHDLCGWPLARCVTVRPRHETEAWVLADVDAILEALGYTGSAAELGLPTDPLAAEALPDPKATLEHAVRTATPRRRRSDATQIFAVVAQTQSLDRLRRAESFQHFESQIRVALQTLGVLAET